MSFKAAEPAGQSFGQIQYRTRFGGRQKAYAKFFRARCQQIPYRRRHGVLRESVAHDVVKKTLCDTWFGRDERARGAQKPARAARIGLPMRCPNIRNKPAFQQNSRRVEGAR
jgi:hypothetical protein